MSITPASSASTALASIGYTITQLFTQVNLIDKPAEVDTGGNDVDRWPKDLFAAEADRFELWAVNLGMFVSGHGSLDYRLREAESLERTLRRFLIDLKDSLTEVLEYSIELTHCSGGEAEDYGSEEELSSWCLDDETENDDTYERDSDLDLLVDSVRDPIDRLYKLSTRIRNPSSRLGSSKAHLYQQIDPDTGVDLLSAIKKYDFDHVRSVFLQVRRSNAFKKRQSTSSPQNGNENGRINASSEITRPVLSNADDNLLTDMDDYLVTRLVHANGRRRQQFAYWKRHRNKLTQHMETFKQHISNPTNQIAAGLEGTADRLTEAIIPVPKLAIAHSVTTASRVNFLRPIDEDARTATSFTEYAPSAWVPDADLPVFPPPPKYAPGEKHFECPYCFTICSTDLLAEKAWK